VERDRDADGNTANGLEQRLYVQQDANYNVTALVDASGNVVERYAYDPFGAVTVLSASWGALGGSAYGFVYGFQGMRQDTVTGKLDFRIRWDDPSLMRFMQDDPINFGGGDTNFYRVEGDNPANSRDPSGLDRIDTVDDGRGLLLLWYVPEKWFWR